MKKFVLSTLFFVVSISCALSAEKVLFGQPSSISAEARQASPDAAKDVTPKDGGRKARVFTFPGSSSSQQHQQQDSRTHQPAYVISSPYETTEDRFSGSSDSDENRLLSLLPSFGSNGMQVGLDFKLPFFSIPYAKMFNALSAPSLGGGIFGGSYGLPSPATSVLPSSLLGGSGSPTSSMATMAAMAVTAALLYPKITGLFGMGGKEGIFRDGGSSDDFFQNVNSVLHQFNIDGESCMKVALCSLGNTKRQQQRATRGRDSSTTSTPADVVEDIINLPAVKKMLSKGGLVQARDFGGSGGDCDYFNAQSKCPIAAETFKSMLSSLA